MKEFVSGALIGGAVVALVMSWVIAKERRDHDEWQAQFVGYVHKAVRETFGRSL